MLTKEIKIGGEYAVSARLFNPDADTEQLAAVRVIKIVSTRTDMKGLPEVTIGVVKAGEMRSSTSYMLKPDNLLGPMGEYVALVEERKRAEEAHRAKAEAEGDNARELAGRLCAMIGSTPEQVEAHPRRHPRATSYGGGVEIPVDVVPALLAALAKAGL
jgi:hypothetical protein